MTLFKFFGIEIELMIVDSKSLAVKPIADLVLAELNGGKITGDVELGPISVSNELVLHVLEFKSTRPTFDLAQQAKDFCQAVSRVQSLLDEHGARLLGSAMHPLMNPVSDRHLWPHDNSEIYAAYDRIFDCRGHGWSNLQSMHINLPFSNDDEFARLHSAVRVLLPFIPALAASSPLVEGIFTGRADSRLFYYFDNQRKIPEIAGDVIPEVFHSRVEYQKMLQEIYGAITPHDPDKLLREEWLNSRGAIARFDRGAIEIRLTDVQECPMMDLAIAALFYSVIKALVEETWVSLKHLDGLSTKRLFFWLQETAMKGQKAVLDWPELAQAFGLRSSAGLREWIERMIILAESYPFADSFQPFWKTLYEEGTLASRIERSFSRMDPSPSEIVAVYSRLADSMYNRRSFK